MDNPLTHAPSATGEPSNDPPQAPNPSEPFAMPPAEGGRWVGLKTPTVEGCPTLPATSLRSG